MVCCSITNEQLARCSWVVRSCLWVSTDFTHGLPVHKWLPIGSFCTYPSAAASIPLAASTAEAAHGDQFRCNLNRSEKVSSRTYHFSGSGVRNLPLRIWHKVFSYVNQVDDWARLESVCRGLRMGVRRSCWPRIGFLEVALTFVRMDQFSLDVPKCVQIKINGRSYPSEEQMKITGPKTKAVLNALMLRASNLEQINFQGLDPDTVWQKRRDSTALAPAELEALRIFTGSISKSIKRLSFTYLFPFQRGVIELIQRCSLSLQAVAVHYDIPFEDVLNDAREDFQFFVATIRTRRNLEEFTLHSHKLPTYDYSAIHSAFRVDWVSSLHDFLSALLELPKLKWIHLGAIKCTGMAQVEPHIRSAGAALAEAILDNPNAKLTELELPICNRYGRIDGFFERYWQLVQSRGLQESHPLKSLRVSLLSFVPPSAGLLLLPTICPNLQAITKAFPGTAVSLVIAYLSQSGNSNANGEVRELSVEYRALSWLKGRVLEEVACSVAEIMACPDGSEELWLQKRNILIKVVGTLLFDHS